MVSARVTEATRAAFQKHAEALGTRISDLLRAHVERVLADAYTPIAPPTPHIAPTVVQSPVVQTHQQRAIIEARRVLNGRVVEGDDRQVIEAALRSIGRLTGALGLEVDEGEATFYRYARVKLASAEARPVVVESSVEEQRAVHEALALVRNFAGVELDSRSIVSHALRSLFVPALAEDLILSDRLFASALGAFAGARANIREAKPW